MKAFILLISALCWQAHGIDLKHYEATKEIPLYSYDPNKDEFAFETNLPPGSVVSFDEAEDIEIFYQDGDSHQETEHPWFSGVQIEGFRKNHMTLNNDTRFVSDLNKMQLFISTQHRENLRQINTRLQYTYRQVPRGFTRITVQSLATIRYRRDQSGGYLEKVVDLGRGSVIAVNTRNRVGRMQYRSSSGDIRMSSRQWIQGVKIISARGSGLSESRIDDINRWPLYVSVDVLSDSQGGGGGGSSPTQFRCRGSQKRVLLTGYAPPEGGINGSCGKSASGLDACRYTLEDYLAGRAPWVMIAVPQTHRHWWKRTIYIKGVKHRGRLIKFRGMDRYGKSSNGKNKMDVCHEKSRGQWFRRLQGTHTVCIN